MRRLWNRIGLSHDRGAQAVESSREEHHKAFHRRTSVRQNSLDRPQGRGCAPSAADNLSNEKLALDRQFVASNERAQPRTRSSTADASHTPTTAKDAKRSHARIVSENGATYPSSRRAGMHLCKESGEGDCRDHVHSHAQPPNVDVKDRRTRSSIVSWDRKPDALASDISGSVLLASSPQLPDPKATSETMLTAVLGVALSPEDDVGPHQERTEQQTRPFGASLSSKASYDRLEGKEDGDLHMGKTVAFAPSPKKPKRAPPVIVSEPSEAEDRRGKGALVSVDSVNYARPTSSHIARSQTRSDSPDAGGRSSKPLPSTNRPSTGMSIPRRTSPPDVSSRRGSVQSAKSFTSPLQRRASPSSLPQTGGPNALLQNSVPFASVRSASPVQSIDSPPRLTVDFNGRPQSARSSLPGRPGSSSSLRQGWTSTGARSVGGPSWSEMTQEDLVANLGARERTRQEVLWEIVASEERYVQELMSTKRLYIDALLGTGAELGKPPASPRSDALATLEGHNMETSFHHLHSEAAGESRGTTHEASDLPIASRYSIGAERQDTKDHSSLSADLGVLREQSRYHRNSSRAASEMSQSGKSIESPQRSSYSRDEKRMRSSTDDAPSSKGRRQTMKDPPRWVGANSSDREIKKKGAKRDSSSFQKSANTPQEIPSLPTALAHVLHALDGGIIEGHAQLSEALKRRYEAQWPLVRSLADVFSHLANLLHLYRNYVVHLERALDVLDEAALMERAMRGKRLRKDRISPTVALGRALANLESSASENGECGVSIFLAMPFQRLLKYPLLFQNLLFHTDASTYEFESTVQMVIDVEGIVRTIEDEKVSKEERDKAIDAFARIEGIKDRQLLRPKRDRLLIEETAMYASGPRRAISEAEHPNQGNVPANALSTPMSAGINALRASVRGRRSYRRLSDFLTPSTDSAYSSRQSDTVEGKASKVPSVGSKRDIWIVRFSDVELRCQRVGVTALPMVSSTTIAASSSGNSIQDDDINDMDENERRIKDEFRRSRESKERQRALRNYTLRSKTRNLYKFIGIVSWKATRDRKPSLLASQMDGVAEEEEQDEMIEEEEGSEAESRDSDDSDDAALDAETYIRQNKLSFSYLGNDRVEPRLSSVPDRLSANSSRSLLTPRMPVVPPLSKHSSSSNLHGALKSSQGQKRYSHSSNTPRSGQNSPGEGQGVPSRVSRAVAANSKARADKFGSRLRPDRQGSHDERARRGPSPELASQDDVNHSGRSSVIKGNARELPEHAHLDQGPEQNTPAEARRSIDAPSRTSMVVPGQRSSTRFPSFIRERSMDSNLRIMGTLVQDS